MIKLYAAIKMEGGEMYSVMQESAHRAGLGERNIEYKYRMYNVISFLENTSYYTQYLMYYIHKWKLKLQNYG